MMRCKVCGIQWKIGTDSALPEQCPICETDLSSNFEAVILENMTEFFLFAKKVYGPEVFKEKAMVMKKKNKYSNYLQKILVD